MMAVVGVLTSCSDEETDFQGPGAASDGDDFFSNVTVILPEYKDDGAATTLDEMLLRSTFQEGDRIFISQMGTTTMPLFPINPTVNTPNLYCYEYDGNTEADWENGYNFVLSPTSGALEWDKIRALGSVGNTFSLYALYFPSGSIGLNMQNQPNVYGVTEWENNRTAQGMKDYDVMGAYHAFSAPYQRLRFRFFHLMVCIRLTLYVPVYDPVTDTGYGDNAFTQCRNQGINLVRDVIPGAFLGLSGEHASGSQTYRNMSRMWTIDYSANRSSDKEGPLVQCIPTTNQSYGDPRSNICMYADGSDDENNPYYYDARFEEMTLTNVKDFYPSSPTNTERVRKYEFTAIFPPQKISGELMYFHLKKIGTPAELKPEKLNTNSVARYYFGVNQLVTGKNDISYTSGTMNHIELFIPRTGNNTVLISAKVLPWTTSFTDMTVVDEDELQSGSKQNVKSRNK